MNKRFLVTFYNGNEKEMDLVELRSCEPNDILQVIDMTMGCNVSLSTLEPYFPC